MDRVFERRRNEDFAVDFEAERSRGKGYRARKFPDRSRALPVIDDVGDIEARFAAYRAVIFDDADNFCARLLKEGCGIAADIA